MAHRPQYAAASGFDVAQRGHLRPPGNSMSPSASWEKARGGDQKSGATSGPSEGPRSDASSTGSPEAFDVPGRASRTGTT